MSTLAKRRKISRGKYWNYDHKIKVMYYPKYDYEVDLEREDILFWFSHIFVKSFSNAALYDFLNMCFEHATDKWLDDIPKYYLEVFLLLRFACPHGHECTKCYPDGSSGRIGKSG